MTSKRSVGSGDGFASGKSWLITPTQLFSPVWVTLVTTSSRSHSGSR